MKMTYFAFLVTIFPELNSKRLPMNLDFRDTARSRRMCCTIHYADNSRLQIIHRSNFESLFYKRF